MYIYTHTYIYMIYVYAPVQVRLVSEGMLLCYFCDQSTGHERIAKIDRISCALTHVAAGHVVNCFTPQETLEVHLSYVYVCK